MVNNLPANAEDVGSIPGSGRYPGEGNGNPLQYSWPENPMDRGAWRYTLHGAAKSQTRLSDFTFFLFHVSVEEKSTSAVEAPNTVLPPGQLPR